jgi:CheY-like chemotaxis protein
MRALVVIVEDHRLHARLLGKALAVRLPDCAIEVFADGQVAMRRLLDGGHPVPHLMVFDLDVPGRSGHDLLVECARSPRLARVPAVVVTASSADADRERSLALGARAHLTKPVDGEGFTRLAERLAALIQAAPAAHHEPAPAAHRRP